MIKKTFGIIILFLCCMAAMAQGEADKLQVYFPVGSAKPNVQYIPETLVDSVKSVCATGEKFAVLGVASPEGSEHLNQRLAMKRAKAIARCLSERTGLNDSMFVLKTKVADVSMLRDLVAQDNSLPQKSQVMDILSEGLSTQATLVKLKRLGGGTPYLYIKDKLFPYLRASVGSTGEQLEYHPDLASINQPLIKNTNAVAQKKETRHSSSNNVAPVSKQDVKTSKTDAPLSEPVISKTDSVPSDTVRGAEKKDTVTVVQTVVSDSEKSSYNFLPWIISLLLLLAVACLVVYYRRRISELKEKLASAEYEVNVRNRQLLEKEDKLKVVEGRLELLEKDKQKIIDEEVTDLKKTAMADLYKDGESLYNHLVGGGSTTQWTNEQIRSFIEYYRMIDYPFVHSLETDYEGLTPNHILFEILIKMGKTDAEIQKVMGISQTTIRSNRFRIKSKKRNLYLF